LAFGVAPMTMPIVSVRRHRAALGFIFVTVMLDMLALGIIIPVLPPLVASFLGGDAARAAEVYGLFGTAWALMQFLFQPLLGALSDRFGRRPVVLISNLGLGLDHLLMALAPSLSWLFVGRLLSGITAATISTGFAYITDVTPPERRAASFGLMGAAFGVGFVLGPVFGGLLGEYGARLPFWAAAALSLANAAYGYFVLPESLPRDRRAPFRLKRANPVGSLVLLRGQRRLAWLGVVNLLTQLARVALPSAAVLYATDRYGWGPQTMGLTLAVVGVCAMIVQAGLVGRIVRQLGERMTLLVGLGFGIAGFLAIGLAGSGAWFVAAVPLIALSDISGPALQGLMTRLVRPDQQGALQGANSSLQGIAGLIGPGVFTLSLAQAVAAGGGWLTGAPFLLAALLLVASVPLVWLLPRPLPRTLPAE
jgi:DHA1 family tetracycline resistance protein-like MFS transporter